MRATRLSTVQRFAQAAENARRWIDERLGMTQTEAVAQKIKPDESVKPTEKIGPTIAPKETSAQKLRRRIEQSRQQQQRCSRGIHM
jgi:hypothetical protein